MSFLDSGRMCRHVWVWPLYILILLGAEVRGEPASPPAANAIQWLTDMRHAVSQLDYKGVIAYFKDHQVESFQVFHARHDGVEQERLVSMNSPLREVVRNAQKVTCYFPDAKTVFVETKPSKRSVLLELPENLSQLQRHYHVILQGREYVARRLSQVIGIEPLDTYRYARRMWVDFASKLPLKFEVLGQNREVVEQMVFTSLNLEASVSQQELEPSTSVDRFTWQIGQREVLPLNTLNWTMDQVPDGFQLVTYTRLKRSSPDHAVEHIMLSDGLSSVSIYIDRVSGDRARGYPRKVGAINAFSRQVGDYLVTVMGEVPAKTVLAIADGLHFQGNVSHD